MPENALKLSSILFTVRRSARGNFCLRIFMANKNEASNEFEIYAEQVSVRKCNGKLERILKEVS